MATFARTAVAESLATAFFFMLGFALQTVAQLTVWQAWGIALALTALLWGGISGAHVNPAVTVALVLGGRLSPAAAFPYVVAQLICGTIALLLTIFLATGSVQSTEVQQFFVLPSIDSIRRVFLLEAGGTFILALVVAVATDKRSQAWAAWVLIGGALGFAIWMVGGQSGGALNPVRALAPFIVGRTGNGLPFTVVAYVLGPLIGGSAAGLLYRVFKDTPLPA